MRFKDRTLYFLVNFLLGVAWATAFLGATSTFLSYYQLSFYYAIVALVVGALPGLFIVLLLEHFITSKEKSFELRKQTKLLEKLLEKD